MSTRSMDEVVMTLKQLLALERESLVEFLVLLGKVDEERRYLELGYASTWEFLRRALGQSETMAHYRLTCARALGRFPQATELLRSGSLCMTTLASLAPVLTQENCDDVLGEAVGKPKTEVLRIKARLDPRPVPKDVVTKLLVPAQVEVSATSPVPALPAPAPVQKEVLTPALLRRHLTTDREFEELLAQARSVLSHRMAQASELDILKAGLRAIIERHEERKGIVKRPQKPRAEPPKSKRTISAHVKREVWLRDGGVCQWPTADGEICGSRTRLELHHIIDRGKGGPSTASNLTVLCRVHNQHAADRVWGKEFMARFRKEPPTQTELLSPPSPSNLERWPQARAPDGP